MDRSYLKNQMVPTPQWCRSFLHPASSQSRSRLWLYTSKCHSMASRYETAPPCTFLPFWGVFLYIVRTWGMSCSYCLSSPPLERLVRHGQDVEGQGCLRWCFLCAVFRLLPALLPPMILVCWWRQLRMTRILCHLFVLAFSCRGKVASWQMMLSKINMMCSYCYFL